MITLITGLPGNGKTIYMLSLVQSLSAKNPERPVYYSGIKGLALPWTNIGGFIKDEVSGETTEVIPADAPVKGGSEWWKLPVGSIIVIDECQNYFRVMGQGSAIPKSVSEFETHRHRGLDIVLLTQHPMLIHANVRRMIERHFHTKRWFGLPGATVHEFGGVKVDVDKSQNGSIRHEFKYPKASYALYKSAEIHTVKARVPSRVYFLFLVPLLVGLCVYIGWKMMAKYATADGAKQRIEGKPTPLSGVPTSDLTRAPGRTPDIAKPLTTQEYVAAFSPRVVGLPHTAPMYDEIMKPVAAPTPAACVKGAGRCSCYTEQGTGLDVTAAICEQVVARGFFRYWAAGPERISSAAAAARAPQAAPAVLATDIPAPVAPVAVVATLQEPQQPIYVRSAAPMPSRALPR